jgi:outer membrane protein assembly factor BamD
MDGIMRKIKFILILSSLSLIAGCSTDEEKKGPVDPQVLFKEGISDLGSGDYKNAVKKFEELEKEHPASDLAPYAQIRRAYASYLEEKFDEAISAVDDFVAQYPLHPNTDYMYYLKGLCYYDQIVDLGRDQNITFKAIDALNEVVSRFPTSPYARDAKLKAEYATNNLAGKEMDIGRFYLASHETVAALNRFKSVIEKYQTSIFVPEALFRVSEIYFYLGDEEQAKKYAAVLGANYPDSEWYEQAYKLNVNKDYGQDRPWYHGFEKLW